MIVYLFFGGKMKNNHKNMSLGDMADEALRKAVAGVVEKHRKSGEPLAVWRDGKVVRVPADQLQGYEKLPRSESNPSEG
ncbi:MAG TPA: hypothetical protein DCZ97_15590 [Syntrophus sp. (in: bacteria)]|nr:hypothetical protein [Syntrophus sp. (in: bacteria)]